MGIAVACSDKRPIVGRGTGQNDKLVFPSSLAVLACEKRANRVPSRPVVTLPASPKISSSLARAALCLRVCEGDGDSHRANHSAVKKSYEHNKRQFE